MATIAILNKEIKEKGVTIPLSKEIYTPILKKLEDYGINFKEKKVPIWDITNLICDYEKL